VTIASTLLFGAACKLTGGLKVWRNRGPDRSAWFIRKIFDFLKMENPSSCLSPFKGGADVRL
jgi:hypothetical protein